MTYNIHKEKDSLVIEVKNLEIDLSFVTEKLNDECRHLILDLLEFSTISEEKLKNFTNFGKTAVKNNSFVIVCQTEFTEDFPIVPTLQEAFDVIELEEIERQLDVEF
jgi:hypothetical protein